MSSQNQGRQSPEPEQESSQQHGSGSSGQGVSDSKSDNTGEDQLKNLTSNPKGPLDDEVIKKFSKTVENTKS